MQGQREAMARLQGVRKRYGALQALDGVDLVLRGGELLALLGPNGAGKTTAIGLLLGLLRADAGQATLFGGDPQDIRLRRHVGVMLQDADLPPTLRVGELIRQAASYYPTPRSVAEAAAIAGIEDLLARPYGKLLAASSGACSSRWRCAAGRACCSSTSPPWAWTSRRGKACGRRSGGSSATAAGWC